MAMKPCRDCKKLLSTSADICPNCGAKAPTDYPMSKITFMRDNSFMGLLNDRPFPITVDDQEIGSIGKNGTFVAEIPADAGEHRIEFRGKTWKLVTKPMKDYVCKISGSHFTGSWKLQFEEL